MRLTFVIGTLQGGGAERVAVTLVNAWARQGHEVVLLTLEPEDAASAYLVSDEVQVRRLGIVRPCLGRFQALMRVARGVFVLRAAIRASRPDAVISFIDEVNVRTVLACMGFGVPVIISERVHPGHYSISWFWNFMRRLTYGRASALVVQTSEIARWSAGRFGAPVHIIPNPVSTPKGRAGVDSRERHLVVGAGRLMPQKGFDLLIRAFAALAGNHPHWDLTIYGEGTERDALEALVREFRLENRVNLPGWKSDITVAMARSDIFCLSSRFEGFPNVLCEAMALGLPVVAAACPGGPADIVTDGHDGLLVAANDAKALERGLRRLIEDRELRKRLGDNAVAVADRFRLDRVADMWIECVSSDPR